MQMELVPIHAAPHEHKVDIKTQCCQILNDEWPRSETLRLRSLDSSRDDLPMCLALVQWFQKDMSTSKLFCIRHVKPRLVNIMKRNYFYMIINLFRILNKYR